jgi:hypothetical protein
VGELTLGLVGAVKRNQGAAELDPQPGRRTGALHLALADFHRLGEPTLCIEVDCPDCDVFRSIHCRSPE